MSNADTTPSILQSDLYLNRLKGFTEIDRSRGRVQKLNGDLYYSPNSVKDVELPDPVNPNKTPFVPPTVHNKQNLWNLDFDSYLKPTWWTVHFGWLAFLDPALVSSYDALLRPLSFSGIVKCEPDDPQSKFVMHPLDKQSWLQLEKLMVLACRDLRSYYDFAAASPPNPQSFGFRGSQPYYNAMAKCLQICRRWYSVWGALLSYSIACSETRQTQSRTHRVFKRSSWMEFLASERTTIKFTRPWIDQLEASAVASFENVERIGTFVDLDEMFSDPAIPDISWFYDYDVPVWYRWSPKHAANPAFAHLGPLSHQLEELVATNIPHPPSAPLLPPSSPAASDDSMDFGPSIFIGGDTTEMEAFFQQRAQRNERILQRESSKERQIRQNRERNPPTVSSTVIIWSRTCTGGYKSSRIMGKENRREYLDSYSDSQKRYDAFHNEWHICHLWAEDNDDQSSYSQGHLSPLGTTEPEDFIRSPSPQYQLPTVLQEQPPELNASLEPTALAHLEGDDEDDGVSLGSEDDDEFLAKNSLEDFLEDDAWSPPSQNQLDLVASSTPSTTTADRLARMAQRAEHEILDVLRIYFGYVTPTMLPEVSPVVENTTRKMFCRAIGIPWKFVAGIQGVFDRPKIRAALDFFHRLSTGQPLQVVEWDFKQGNKECLRGLTLFRHLRQVKTTANKFLYLVDFGSAKSAKWILGLRRASDAMMVIRVAADLTEYELVEHLLVNGIPFHTLQASSTVQRIPHIIRRSLEPMIRPTNHTFTKSDYLSYRERCRVILEHHRGRAALMHGGYHWRLAMGVVKWEDVLRGPSGLSANLDEMVLVNDERYGQLFDDQLSEKEANALCGMYEVPTGIADQIAFKSWFMPADVYQESAIDLGRWSMHSEDLFQVVAGTFDDQSLAQSSSETTEVRQPLSKKKWKNRSRSTSTLHKATRRVEDEAVGLF